MDLVHGRACRLHRLQSLLVDIRRFDGVDLLFQLGDLCRRLFEVLLMDLFPSESSLSGWSAVALVGSSLSQQRTMSIRTVLICADILLRHIFLLLHLILQVLLPLLKHIELFS